MRSYGGLLKLRGLKLELLKSTFNVENFVPRCTASPCLSVLLLDWTTVAEAACFEWGTQI